MTTSPSVMLIALLASIFVGGYGLHRLFLSLEERGLMYYIRTKPQSGAMSCFVALQRELEPSTQIVERVLEEKRSNSEDETPGADGEHPPTTS